MKSRTLPTPRGIRNNNPLNIRIGNVWLGEVAYPTDPDFEQFVSMMYGIRAACILMRRYINHYRRTTIPEIIAAWAPSSENNTAAYIDRVCNLTGFPHDMTITYTPEIIVPLLRAMAFIECGRNIEERVFFEAFERA